ncbi:MAG: phospholipase [Thalassobius sp.]|nr:phospholipase [Thalassovita sp.]
MTIPQLLKKVLNIKTKPQPIALVLSSGGARGFAHIGVINELLKNNFEITSIAGTSMGSIIAGIYAAGKLDEFTEWACSVNRMGLFKLVDFTFSTRGFIRGDRVLNEIKKIVGDLNIEDLNIPYVAVATDIHSQKEVVFREGCLFEAMRASMAIPTIFTPSELNGRELIDGGILNPVPVDLIERHEGDFLVVVNVNANVSDESDIVVQAFPSEKGNEVSKNGKAKKIKRQYGFFDLLTSSFDLTQDKLTEMILEKHKPDILINVSRNVCSTFDFHRGAEIIEVGKEAFKNRIIY